MKEDFVEQLHEYTRRDHHTDHKTDNNYKWIVPVTISCFGVILAILVIYLCRRRRIRNRSRRQRVITRQCPPVYVIPDQAEIRSPEDVMRRYQRSASYNSQVFLVPFSALPPNFDFASRDVEVKADYVILKDLSMLETSHQESPSTVQIYEQQLPYYSNGTLSTTTSVVYQKQDPYNPNYYSHI